MCRVRVLVLCWRAQLAVYNTARLVGVGSKPRLTVDASSSLSFYGRYTSVEQELNIINRGALIVRPSSSLVLKSNASLQNFASLVLGQDGIVRDTDAGESLLVNERGGSVLLNGTLATLALTLNHTGTIAIPSGKTLRVNFVTTMRWNESVSQAPWTRDCWLGLCETNLMTPLRVFAGVWWREPERRDTHSEWHFVSGQRHAWGLPPDRWHGPERGGQHLGVQRLALLPGLSAAHPGGGGHGQLP